MHGFAQVIHEQEDRGIGSGLQRKAWWMDNQQPVTKTGNAANAEQAMKKLANQVRTYDLWIPLFGCLTINLRK